VDDAVAQGANILAGGTAMTDERYKKGFFFAPTVIANVTPTMRLFREEVFGPILPLISFSTEEEVLRMANDTEYGLAAFILAKDMATTLRVSGALSFGIIGVNDFVPNVAQAPFGGMKESGFGKEGGSEGLEAFMEKKYISIVS